MDNPDLWEIIDSAWQAVQAGYESGLESLNEDTGLGLHDWGFLVAALIFEPDFITPAHLMVRSPFMAAEVFQEHLGELEAGGYLEQVEPGMYRLSKRGRQAVERFIYTVRQTMKDADPLSPQDGAQLAALLGRLLAACRQQTQPPNHWSLDLSYKLMPEMDPPLPYVEQVMTCLNAFRDDTFIYAWRSSGMSATALEVLTLLWNGEAETFDQVCARLAYRGHDCHVYEDVIKELNGQGWVDMDTEAVWITSNGRIFRNQVELQTEEHFFRSWDVLSPEEKIELAQLLTRLEADLLPAAA